MTKRDKAAIQKRLRRRMNSLGRLQQDLRNPPAGRLRDTINNIAVQGRSITNVLQNLRYVVSDFDEWYAPYQEQMRQDELMRFFYNLRNESLKRGEDGIRGVAVRPGRRPGSFHLGPEGISYVIHHADGSEERSFFPKPNNAVASFLGDTEGGGAGWIVESADGSRSHVYVKTPSDIVEISLYFSNPPQTHLGKPIEDCSAENLCDLYIAYLTKLVSEAEGRFGGA